MKALQPCPCCPESALVQHIYEDETIITCTVCGVRADIDAWNRRPIEDALRAELSAAEARAENAEAWASAVQAQISLLCPEIGPDCRADAKKIGCALRGAKVRWRNCAEKAKRERDALLEALTPSTETKMAYMSEVKDNGRFVSWIAIKEIMAMIRKRAEQQSAQEEGGQP